MKVLVADYGGYPFTLQLARHLSGRGHVVGYACRDVSRLRDVMSQHAAGSESGMGVRFAPIDSEGRIEKGNLLARWTQERRFGRSLARFLMSEAPDVVLSANMPLDAQSLLLRAAARQRVAFVYWLQDLIGTATAAILSRRLGPLGTLVGRYYVLLENRLLAASDAVLGISEAFGSALSARGVEPRRLLVEPNWSPLEELPEAPRDNAWARENDLSDRPVVMYSGSLGMKHDPRLLVDLASALGQAGDALLVVVAEGSGADWLTGEVGRRGIDSVRVLPFQDRSRLPEVLGTADVSLVLLAPTAGSYSVPSKVLSYLCAGRPVVAAIPSDNDVAELLTRTDSGLVASPSDAEDLATAVLGLLGDKPTRDRMGRNGRVYAESAFDIEAITGRFEEVLETAVARRADGAAGA